MLIRPFGTLLLASLLCSAGRAETPTKICRIGQLHVGMPGTCILLHGAKPADLPLELPARFRFSVNLKTAQDLGLIIPEAIVVRADDVVE